MTTMLRKSRAALLVAGSAAIIGWGIGATQAADQPYAGVTLTMAAESDQFAAVLAQMAPEFKKATGIDLKVEIMDYGTELTKTTADFVGHTGAYDLVTMDIVWAGSFYDNHYSFDLTDWVKRDAAEIGLDDIYPSLLSSLGQWQGHYVAFPFAGYANVLAYNKAMFKAAGLDVPKTMEEFVSDAEKLTDPSKNQYGFVANGQAGAPSAQDWMQYNSQLGGSLMGADGKPALNSDANVHSLEVYKELFDKAAPPGAVQYDWGGRETSFRQGQVAMMQTWSVGAPAYFDPSQSKVVDSAALTLAPVAAGMKPTYGVGGWALAINNDASEQHKEAAWAFIKWLDSKPVHKEFNMTGAGAFFIRKSEMTDPDITAKYPFMPVIAQTFENGNGEFRPRIPQYPDMQDLVGKAVNSVLAGQAKAKDALDEAQAAAIKLF